MGEFCGLDQIAAITDRLIWVERSLEAHKESSEGPAQEETASANQKERTVKKFVLLHYGFEKPTPEIMTAWGKWFEAMKDNIVDMGGHFSRGREISKAGTRDLPLGLESITGFTIVSAGNLDDAEKMAQSNPFISSIRIYEVMSK